MDVENLLCDGPAGRHWQLSGEVWAVEPWRAGPALPEETAKAASPRAPSTSAAVPSAAPRGSDYVMLGALTRTAVEP